MTLMEHHLQQQRMSIDLHRLELSGLEVGALVGLERQVAESREVNVAEGNLGVHDLAARGDEGEELDLGGDLGLVGEELDLAESTGIRELENDLLRVLAELGALPALALGTVGQQLGHGVVRFLAWGYGAYSSRR